MAATLARKTAIATNLLHCVCGWLDTADCGETFFVFVFPGDIFNRRVDVGHGYRVRAQSQSAQSAAVEIAPHRPVLRNYECEFFLHGLGEVNEDLRTCVGRTYFQRTELKS